VAKVEIPECRDCSERDLRAVEHPENGQDWSGGGSSQSYKIFQCQKCRSYWGCRFQYDAGTGSDNRWHRFGRVDPSTIKRHY
jgi:hypothetical protein